MVAKKEGLAKFMYDLTCDQETKQLLLTEADYTAACVMREEINTFQPLSKEETRTKLLNQWNSSVSNDLDETQSSYTSSSGTTEKKNSNHTGTGTGTNKGFKETGVQVPSQERCTSARKEAGFTENKANNVDTRAVSKCQGFNLCSNMSKKAKSCVSRARFQFFIWTCFNQIYVTNHEPS